MSKYLLFLIFLICCLVFIWYSPVKQIAAGEESFSIFNKVDTFVLNGLWGEVGTGYGNATYLVRIPLSLVVAALNDMGIPLYFIQGLLYLFLILTGTISIYKLSLSFLESVNNSHKIAFAISLFYFFNIYSMVQIWGRFLYSSSFLWAYLPLLLFIWISLFNKFNYQKLFFFIGSSVVFCLSSLQPAHIITLWSPPFLWVLVQIWINRKDQDYIKRILLKAIGFLAIWILFNSWWMYPYIKVSNDTFATISSPKTSIDTLEGVSKYFTTDQILLLRHKFYFGKDTRWYEYYSQAGIQGLSYLVLIITFIGWVKFKKHYPIWLYLTVLLFVGWFISKGSNPPLGKEFFSWLFYNFPFMGSLRNPYEKYALVFLLPYTIFFGFGLYSLRIKASQFLGDVLFGLILILVCFILVFPMWNGFVVSNKYTEIPSYYTEANQWINSQKDDYRLLHIPLTPGDSYTYSWGYNGIEPSEFIFDKPSVSKMIRDKYYDKKYFTLVNKFNSGAEIKELLAEMGIGYIIVHRDISPTVKWGNVAEVKKTLELNDIKLVKSFGELDIYKLEGISNKLIEIHINGQRTNQQVRYTKVSPTRYIVHINNQQVSPYEVVFKSTYNKHWQAKINDEVINEHVLVYDYANSWKINKQGTYDIEIMFKVIP